MAGNQREGGKMTLLTDDLLTLDDGTGSVILEDGGFLLLESSIVGAGRQLQTAVYEKLYPVLTPRGCGVYDEVPELPAGMPNEKFPYVEIADTVFIPFDTDDTTGWRAHMTFHIWSRSRGKQEAYQIEQMIYDALNREPVTLQNYVVIDALRDGPFAIRRDPDNVTIHGFGDYVFTGQDRG